jgi:hypothetical protein
LSQRRKLLDAICNNPADVSLGDACKAAELMGFDAKAVKGSHHAYVRSGEIDGLNFQDRNGRIPTYQARQLIKMIIKYGDGIE